MDGLELLKLMRENDKLKDIPVVMMSAEGEEKIVAMCLANDAKNYYIKPLRIGDVKVRYSYR
jgi:DNA-binding response OmpR family regulator